MSQEDNYATEIEHGTEVIQLSLPASNQAPEVVQPGKEAFDLPTTAIAA